MNAVGQGFLVLFCIVAQAVTAQVIISPEIGVSHAPLLLHGTNSYDESKNFDLIYGLYTRAKLSDRLSLNLRFTYFEREELAWQDLCFACDLKRHVYTSSDLNIDLDLAYTLRSNISIWVGPSLTRKITAVLTTEFFNNSDIVADFRKSYFGINGFLSYSYHRFLVRATYVRRFEPDDLGWVYTEGIHRLDFTIGYALFGYRKFREGR